jgi:hypothetical protein
VAIFFWDLSTTTTGDPAYREGTDMSSWRSKTADSRARELGAARRFLLAPEGHASKTKP